MNNSKKVPHYIVTAALIAAAYAALTYISAAMGLAYGSIQFRLSEALNTLALFTPAAVPGLIIGCIIGNLGSPLGLVDILIGTAATAFSAITIRLMAKFCKSAAPYLSVLPPTLFNAVLVGLEITWFLPNGITLAGFAASALSVAAGEAVICAVLGIPLYFLIKQKIKFNL